MANRVGFGPRLMAFILDIVIVIALAMVLLPFIGALVGGAASGGDEVAAALGMIAGIMAAFIALPLIATVYFLIEAVTGATPGKMILGLKVGTPEGTAGDIKLYATRYAIKNISFILSAVGAMVGVAILGTAGTWVGLVIFLGTFMVLGSKKQALHDLLAKTAIYKKADLAAAGGPADMPAADSPPAS